MSQETNRPNQSVSISKILLVALIIASALGLFSAGYLTGNLNPKLIPYTVTQPGPVVVETQVSYVTQSETQTVVSQVTQSVTETQSLPNQYYPTSPSSQGAETLACSYPLNDPSWCAQVMGDYPAQTVQGMLVLSGSCYFLHTGYAQDYVLYNAPSNIATYLNSNVQAYGYVFNGWQGAYFPLNPPFSYSLSQCGGIPVWLLPPYFQLW